MSLLEEQFEEFCFMEKTKESDGEGGAITTWKDGMRFLGIANEPSSGVLRVADAVKGSVTYTITVKQNITLDFYDVIRRLSDNMIFRITSKSADNKTPASSNLDIRQASAEEWKPK